MEQEKNSDVILQFSPCARNAKDYILPEREIYLHKLDIIENQFSHCQELLTILNSHISSENLSLYPLRSKQKQLAKIIAEKNDCNINQIIISCGSDSILKAICEATIWPRTKNAYVLVPTPTYPHFLEFAQSITSQFNLPIIKISVELPETYNYNINTLGQITVAKIFDYLSADIASQKGANCLLCYICSPNLPLGYNLQTKDFTNLLANFPNTFFIVDEAYVKFGGNTMIALIKEYKNLIITRSFSKSHGLAGLRIGYAISDATNINMLRPLINAKSILNISIEAAIYVSTTFAPFYSKIIRTIKNQKKYIAYELQKICSIMPHNKTENINEFSYPLITKFSMGGGNFYLIYSNKPRDVVTIFENQGIIVRDKSDDVKGAIRIAVGRPEQNKDCMQVCYMINLMPLLRISQIIFDLDNTLRKNSKNYIQPFEGAKLFNLLNSRLYTNNASYTPKEISEYLKNNSIVAPENKIITPLTIVRDMFIENKIGELQIFGSQNIINWFANNTQNKKSTSDQKIIFLANDYFINMEQICAICSAAKDNTKLYYAGGSDKVTLSDCADSEIYSDLIIPDIESVIKMLAPFIETKRVSKSGVFSLVKKNTNIFVKNIPVIIIGDSDEDELLAKNCAAELRDHFSDRSDFHIIFIHIKNFDKKDNIYCEFNKDIIKFVISSTGAAINLLHKCYTDFIYHFGL